MKPLVARCCFVFAFCCSISAVAQEQAEPPGEPAVPKTRPADYGFGNNQLSERFEFPDASDYLGRVDRRDELDATPHRTILWPTAHTPEQFTVSLSTFMLALNQLSFSPTDDLQLSATLLVPTDVADLRVGLAAKISLAKTANTELSLQPFGMSRWGNGELAARDVGAGVAVLYDFIVTNNLVMTLGAAAYGTVWFAKDVYNYDNCENRSDYISGACRETLTEGTSFPRGGHFMAAQVAGTYYIFDSLSLRGELFSGLAAGSVLGTEFIEQRPDFLADRARFEEGGFGVGVPFGSGLTGGMGLAWSNGLFAAQFSGYVVGGDLRVVDDEGEPVPGLLFTPMLNLAVAI